jgi:predicted HAD superfamily Cof-like phosphohydrolase
MIVESVIEFRTKFGLPIPSEPTPISPSELLHALGCLQEELIEFETHVNGYIIEPNQTDDAGMFDALIDLVYFAVGIGIRRGWDFEEGFGRVHVANMLKELAGSKANKRQSSTDLIKPQGWEPANLDDLVSSRTITVGELLCSTNGSNSALSSPAEATVVSMQETARSFAEYVGNCAASGPPYS